MISIAMTTYNGGKYLQAQLDSFIVQSTLPDELVVCDDGSSDDSLAILERFKATAPFAVQVIRNETNLGFTRNFEKALLHCRGEIIFLSDQDDVWDSGKIRTVVAEFAKSAATKVVINDARYVNESLVPSGETVMRHIARIEGSARFHTQGSCTAITSEFRDFVAPFPVTNCPIHDTYLHRWANFLGLKSFITESLQVWRIHGSNNSNNVFSETTTASSLDVYQRFKGIDPSQAYVAKAAELQEMLKLTVERRKFLSAIADAPRIDAAVLEITRNIEALMTRSRLSTLGYFSRLRTVLHMAVSGQYRHFLGYRSFLKDLLRL